MKQHLKHSFKNEHLEYIYDHRFICEIHSDEDINNTNNNQDILTKIQKHQLYLSMTTNLKTHVFQTMITTVYESNFLFKVNTNARNLKRT